MTISLQKIVNNYCLSPKFEILSKNNLWVKKYNSKTGKIDIKEAAINKLYWVPASLIKL